MPRNSDDTVDYLRFGVDPIYDDDPVVQWSNLHDGGCAKICLNPYHEDGVSKAIDVTPIIQRPLLGDGGRDTMGIGGDEWTTQDGKMTKPMPSSHLTISKSGKKSRSSKTGKE